MKNFSFQQVDVFSSSPLGGNPLAVVVGADGMSDAQMAAFANWTNLSETTFLQRPQMPGADYRVRIFTPHQELPFAGHPTLGSCHVWLQSGGRPNGNEVVQECGIGLVRIRRLRNMLSFAAPALRRNGPVEAGVLARVIDGLSLSPNAIVAASWVDNGADWLAVHLRSRDEVLAIRPKYPAMTGLRVGVVGAWAVEKDGPDAQFEVRAFTAEGYEDPVTGSLNAGLAQWLMKTGVAPSTYVASQGTALGRIGRVHAQREGSEIWVGGVVTTCIAGILTL